MDEQTIATKPSIRRFDSRKVYCSGWLNRNVRLKFRITHAILTTVCYRIERSHKPIQPWRCGLQTNGCAVTRAQVFGTRHLLATFRWLWVYCDCCCWRGHRFALFRLKGLWLTADRAWAELPNLHPQVQAVFALIVSAHARPIAGE